MRNETLQTRLLEALRRFGAAMIEHKDGGWMIYKDHIAAVDELLEIIDGQVKVIKRHQKIEASLKVIAIWALHQDEDTLSQIHRRAMEALGE